ncbi:hypothetical protein [Streptomyces cyaneofuscatus]|uniref:hypothetical protein n=1 Tax=Streptomyces cyaneofuscatus TaxID=66883 RepID=UPI00365EDF8C
MKEMTPTEETDLGAIQGTGDTTSPNLEGVIVTEVKPEDIGALSLRYVDGVAQLAVSGGTAIPAGLRVVDGSGNAVAVYTAGAITPLAKSSRYEGGFVNYPHATEL